MKNTMLALAAAMGVAGAAWGQDLPPLPTARDLDRIATQLGLGERREETTPPLAALFYIAGMSLCLVGLSQEESSAIGRLTDEVERAFVATERDGESYFRGAWAAFLLAHRERTAANGRDATCRKAREDFAAFALRRLAR